jgi:3-oxoacyl-[acyl-carrier protein] reductase
MVRSNSCARITESYRRVDVLVNPAAVTPRSPAARHRSARRTASHQAAEVTWRWTGNLRLNMLTAVLATQALKPLLADGARVLLFSSIAAFRARATGPTPPQGCPAPARDRPGRRAEAPGITNVVAPGYIAGTEFFGNAMTAEREQT